ncbi:MAG: hypothetical protein ACPG6V_04220 [Flavobacteriales bacterium]
MKKTIAIIALFVIAVGLQSCCSTNACPGLSSVEQTANSNC